MALADLILVIGLTPRGGTHILYSGSDAAAAARALDKVGPEFSEAILLPIPAGASIRKPAEALHNRRQAASDARARQEITKADRIARFRAESLARREAAKQAAAQRRAAGGAAPAAPPEPAGGAAESEVTDKETQSDG